MSAEQSVLFELGCAAIWANLGRAAHEQGCSFKPLAPVIERGDEAEAFFVFAFELGNHLTQITVHIDDILTSSRLWCQIDRTVKSLGGLRTKTV